MKAVSQWVAGLLVVLSAFSATAPAENLPEIALFSPEQLEQLVAPIALYPDAMVAQILMAATYPLQVVQASRWRQRNPHLSGKDLDDAVIREERDPSVKSLLQFPDLLKRMDENLD